MLRQASDAHGVKYLKDRALDGLDVQHPPFSFTCTTLIALKSPTSTPAHPGPSWNDDDIRRGLYHHRSIEKIADFLCRTSSEVRQRIEEIAEADAIGDRSLLRDGLTDRDRTALETYWDARTALALIREAIEDCAPSGSWRERTI